MVPVAECVAPRALFLVDGVSSVRSLDAHHVWHHLKSSPYVEAWRECGGLSQDAPLPLGAACGTSTLEADRFAQGFYAKASRSIRSAPVRDLKNKLSRGAGAQLLREAARAAAVWDFVSTEDAGMRSCWSMVASLGEELCALPRLAFINMLEHRLCTCGAARRYLRHGGLLHLLPNEVAALRARRRTEGAAGALEAAGASRERVLHVAAELSMRGLRLTDHMERQILDSLAETAITSAKPCERCRKRPATRVVMLRCRGQKPLTLRAGKEARFLRKIDAQRRKHPRSRWRLQRTCLPCCP